MSTSVEFLDEKECEYALGAVRSDELSEKFVIFGHEDNKPNVISLIVTGSETSEIVNHVDDDQIMYILARYESKYEMSSSVKFVYIRWVGDGVPGIKKGKFAVVLGSIVEKLGQSHARIETGSRDELSDEYIQQKLAETAGQVSKVLDSTEGCQQRGFTASQTTQRSAKSNATVMTSFSQTKQAIELDDEVYTSIDAVRNDMDQTTWTLIRYDDGRMKGPMRSVANGRGDLMELKANLDQDLVMYGLYRVTDVVDDIQTVKFVFIMWVGQDVKPFVKAKVSTHRGTIEEAFKPVHVSVIASELAELSDRIVKDKVMSASGSKSWVK